MAPGRPRPQDVTLTRTKGGGTRTVPLSGAAAGTLAGTPRRLGCPWVFWHGEGERYRNLSSRLREIGRTLEPPIRFRIHDLRHLTCSRSIT